MFGLPMSQFYLKYGDYYVLKIAVQKIGELFAKIGKNGVFAENTAM
jgi:hypothetical protein